MALLLEDFIPCVKYGGLNTAKDVSITGSLTVTGSTNIGSISLTDLTVTGNTIIGNALTDTLTITGASSVTSSSASALVAGLNGATNPALQVDASTATSATGIKVKSAAAAGGIALSAISSGANESLTLDAKGTGTISLNTVGTGNIVLGAAATGVSLSVTGAATLKSGTAVPATAGAAAAGAPIVLNSNLITIEATTDVPTHTRPKGSLCINLGGSSTTTRLYVNTDGAGTWTAFTSQA